MRTVIPGITSPAAIGSLTRMPVIPNRIQTVWTKIQTISTVLNGRERAPFRFGFVTENPLGRPGDSGPDFW